MCVFIHSRTGKQSTDILVCINTSTNTTYYKCKQESLANAKVSARQPWHIGRNSLNLPHLGSPSNINVIYTSLKSTFSAQ